MSTSVIRIVLTLFIQGLRFGAFGSLLNPNVGVILECLAQTPSIDPILGKLELQRDIYCSKNAGKAFPGFIDGLSCCYPMSTDEFHFKMYLYLPSDNSSYQEVSFADQEIRWTLQRYSKVVYIIHGFNEKPLNSVWIKLIREHWNNLDVPVIVIDYSYGDNIDYFQMMANVRTVGMAVGHSIINWDIADRTLLIGFSLGGQTIGHVGHYVNQNSGTKIAECHALDPAGPFFIGAPIDGKLDKSDCAVVQVIHMTATLNHPLTLVNVAVGQEGTDEKSGHCDFWVNCGYGQFETCAKGAVASAVDGDVGGVMDDTSPACGHPRTTVIYVNELYQKCNFTSDDCANCGNKNVDCQSGDMKKVNKLPPNSECNSHMDSNFVVFTDEGSNRCTSYIEGSMSNPISD